MLPERCGSITRRFPFGEDESAPSCEAALGRLRGAGIPIVMVVDDGEGGLECWCDADPASYRLLVSRGRCPGGTNAKTGKIHRVLWADPGTRVPWEEDFELVA